MALSLKKYLVSALKFSIAFTFLTLICIGVSLVDTIDTGVFVVIVIPVSVIMLLLPAGNYFALFFAYRKKCTAIIPEEGIVANWEAGYFRGSGSIIVIVNGVEFSTSAYFRHDECKDLVGKTILYTIFDDTLFVYEIKEQS